MSANLKATTVRDLVHHPSQPGRFSTSWLIHLMILHTSADFHTNCLNVRRKTRRVQWAVVDVGWQVKGRNRGVKGMTYDLISESVKKEQEGIVKLGLKMGFHAMNLDFVEPRMLAIRILFSTEWRSFERGSDIDMSYCRNPKA